MVTPATHLRIPSMELNGSIGDSHPEGDELASDPTHAQMFSNANTGRSPSGAATRPDAILMPSRPAMAAILG